MVSISKFKMLLGDEAQDLSDKEIEEIRDLQYRFAGLALDLWVKKKINN